MKQVFLSMGLCLTALTAHAQVGVNTDTPQATLDIKSIDNKPNTKALKITNSDNVELLTVTDKGNVGIGETAPVQKLHINGTGVFQDNQVLLGNSQASVLSGLSGGGTPLTYSKEIKNSIILSNDLKLTSRDLEYQSYGAIGPDIISLNQVAKGTSGVTFTGLNLGQSDGTSLFRENRAVVGKYGNLSHYGNLKGALMIRNITKDAVLGNRSASILMKPDASINFINGDHNTAPTLTVQGNKVFVKNLTGADATTDVVVTADATTGELKEAGTIADILAQGPKLWAVNSTANLVELTTKSDGTTVRDAGTEVVITDTGNVGIGETAPVQKLHINGTGLFQDNQVLLGNSQASVLSGLSGGGTPLTYSKEIKNSIILSNDIKLTSRDLEYQSYGSIGPDIISLHQVAKGTSGATFTGLSLAQSDGTSLFRENRAFVGKYGNLSHYGNLKGALMIQNITKDAVLGNRSASILMKPDASINFINGNHNTAPTLTVRGGNVGVGNITQPEAKLDVNGYIKLGSADTTGDAVPKPGMLRYNTTTNKFQGYVGGTTNAWVNLN